MALPGGPPAGDEPHGRVARPVLPAGLPRIRAQKRQVGSEHDHICITFAADVIMLTRVDSQPIIFRIRRGCELDRARFCARAYRAHNRTVYP